MALKTTVKVGKISNLSDARYCSGMGVSMLGFVVTEGSESYLPPAAFKELRGWFTGPAVVAQVHGPLTVSDLQTITDNYQPDYLELSLKEFTQLKDHLTIPSIVNVSSQEVESVSALPIPVREKIAYIQLSTTPETTNLKALATAFKVMMSISSIKEAEALPTLVSAIALAGSEEERPGLKNYDTLASILELLETED